MVEIRVQGVSLRLVLHHRFDSSINPVVKSNLSKNHHKMRHQHSVKGSMKKEHTRTLCREIRYIMPIEKNKTSPQKSKLQHHWEIISARVWQGALPAPRPDLLP